MFAMMADALPPQLHVSFRTWACPFFSTDYILEWASLSNQVPQEDAIGLAHQLGVRQIDVFLGFLVFAFCVVPECVAF